MRVPEDADRDFVAGCIIVEDGEVLMLDHGKYDIWLPPGGHVEGDETPDETAVRETREETGIEVEIVDAVKPDIKSLNTDRPRENLPRPFNVNLHKVKDGHYHCDFLYLGEPVEKGEASHGHEHNGLKWFSLEELEEKDHDMPEDYRQTAIKALEIMD